LNTQRNAIASGTASDETDALVTFLIVAHNAGEFLLPCVRSAVAQTHPQIEVVLVDNASSDGSVERLGEMLGPEPRLSIMRLPANLGPGGGAVAGLPLCRGEFIARMDADDIAPANRIELELDYLRMHPGKDAVGGDVERIDRSGRYLGVRLALRTEFLRRYGAKWEVGTNHTTLMLRRTAARERFYNPTLFTGIDFEYIEWIAAQGKLGRRSGRLGYYRQHSSSITQSRATLQRLGGAELAYRISEAGDDRVKRDAIATEDFSWIRLDPRLSRPAPMIAHELREKCRISGHILGAAYFSSISGRWAGFFVLLPKALWAGAPWREVLALALMRTAWPVWKRIHGKLWRFCGAR
jgi:glycosyltransferase involved in cell wall biosynthesis